MALRIYEDTRLPSITGTISVDGVAVDLTGKTVKFKMRAVGSATLKVNSAASVVTPAAGTVRYDWGATDLDTPGDYLAWWEVTTTADGKVQDHPEFLLDIQTHAQPSGYLCEVSDVRLYLDKPGEDRAQDSIIEQFIRRASTAIESYTQREFTDKGTLTRRFRVDNVLVDFAPYELRTSTGGSPDVPTVTLNPESGSPTVLTADVGYTLEPFSAIGATYHYLRLDYAQTFSTSYVNRFGHALLDIAGKWGMETIPQDVRQAAVTTVGMWMRREVQAFSTTFNIDEGRLERPEAIPSAVRGLLEPYRRVAIA